MPNRAIESQPADQPEGDPQEDEPRVDLEPQGDRQPESRSAAAPGRGPARTRADPGCPVTAAGPHTGPGRAGTRTRPGRTSASARAGGPAAPARPPLLRRPPLRPPG